MVRKTLGIDGKIRPCGSCGAHVVKAFDYRKDLFYWFCTNCGKTRFDPDAEFEVQFKPANKLG